VIVSSGLKLAEGRYEFGSLIAVGGMGEVWRGQDAWASRTVAIKVLRPEFTGDEASLHRLRTEAHNAAMLAHPNIARVYDYREEEGTGYLVLEYVPGQSLADVLAVQSTMPAHQLIDILHQCAEGLFAAHRAGVVHRDVKPGNILLGPSGRVKLTDFGISVCLGQAALTATGKVMGTAQYLAPEQALGKPATPAGDMYALGIIAYECLAGTRPFNTGGDVDIALAQVRQPPPPLPAWVDPSLRDLVFRLLAKDPAKRPATCGELAHALLRLAPALPSSSPETSPVDLASAHPETETDVHLTAEPAPPPTQARSPETDTDVQVQLGLGEQPAVAAPNLPPSPPLTPALATPRVAAPDRGAGESLEDAIRVIGAGPEAGQTNAAPAVVVGADTQAPPRPAPPAPRPMQAPPRDPSPTRRRRRLTRNGNARAAVPFALLLLCLAAIIAGILLSGANSALFGAAAGDQRGADYSISAMCAEDNCGRGIILGDTLSPRSLPFHA
jgi:serine/threonine-protein kinase